MGRKFKKTREIGTAKSTEISKSFLFRRKEKKTQKEDEEGNPKNTEERESMELIVYLHSQSYGNGVSGRKWW